FFPTRRSSDLTLLGQICHECVTAYLGEDSGGGHAHAAQVTLDLGAYPPGPTDEVVRAVQEHRVGARGQLAQRTPGRPSQRLGHADLVDLGRFGPSEGMSGDPGRDLFGELLAAWGCQAFGVGEPVGWGTLPGNDRAHQHRSGPGTTADLVHPGHHAGTSATELVLDLEGRCGRWSGLS